MSHTRSSSFGFVLSLGLIVCQTSAAEETSVSYETDIQPILVKKCGKCHSETVRKGGLNLASMLGIRKGGESGESAVAEKLDDSLLWIMIDSGEMPPEKQPALTDAETTTIRTWIEAGTPSQQPVEIAEKTLTQHDVLPTLLLRCTACHGRQLKRGDLDLRTISSIRKGGKSGPAFIAGDPDASLMIKRIESEACPPRDQLLKYFVKRPPASEVKKLRAWIKAGAPEGDIQPDIATTEPDPLVTDEDRQHWAFQSPKATVDATTIDEFILKKLQERGLTFSPEADRDTLIRRAYFDLTGLPPTPDEWKQWSQSENPNWYARMIDELLASPRYGERWGRYWLDMAGYANSEGGVSADPVRQVAWKYRDYVIRAFNTDKPYDRFLLEQIAGDELLDYERAENITEEMVENLIATGFLRMGIDQTGSRTMNFVPERLGVINDAIRILGSGVMGITLECARCHTHKYDPIPHRDYYRFKAIFQGALDENDWLTFKNRSLNLGTSEHRQRIAANNPPLKKELSQLESRLKKAITNLRLETLRQHYPNQSEADRQETLRALKIADNNRSQPQRILVEKLQRAEVIPDHEQPAPVQTARRLIQKIEREILAVQEQMEPPLTIRALWDRGQPSPTYILLRGEHEKPSRLVGPGVPSVLTDGKTPFVVEPPFSTDNSKTGRRLAFARWLTNPEHPLTARVMVNRLWYHHFGTGLVKTLSNFGVQGERPSHLELLDWLAVEFVNRGWSMKAMHRLMMNSRTYRQSSRITGSRRELDPQNRLLSRMPLRRMNAEAIRDSLLYVSGKLDETRGGPPDRVAVSQVGEVMANPTTRGGWRRSIYLQYRRTEIPTMMDTFDYPEMGPNCVERNVSTVSPQSLMLMHNRQVRELAAAFAQRVRNDVKEENHDAIVKLVYQLALSRLPNQQELELGVLTLKQLETIWAESSAKLQTTDEKNPRQAALETYCHTILNSAAFLYLD